MVETFSSGAGDERYTRGLRQMLEDGDYSIGSNSDHNHKAQVMTKFMLLERLATALDCASSDKFVTARVPSTELINTKLQPVVKATNRWYQAAEGIRTHLENLHAMEESMVPGLPRDSLSSPQEPRSHTINLLLRARHSFQKSDYFIAEGNLALVAFMVNWHSTVRYPVHSRGSVFMNQQISA